MEPRSTFASRFQSAFDASKYKSLRKLSLDSGCNPSQAAKIVRGDFDESKDGPSLNGTYRMAENMGVTLNDLQPPSRPPGFRPDTKEFFKRWRGDKTSIEQFEDIIEFFDIYEEPRMGRCKLRRQGSMSLLTQKTNLKDVAKQQAEYDSWPAEKRAELFNWQRLAWDNGSLAEAVHFEGTYGFHALNLKGWILKAACRVLDHDLKPMLILHGEMLWEQE